jgi:ribonuclease D
MIYEYVTDDAALARLCDRLAGADWVAFDTEFVRERTYWPKLCLIQVADRDGLVACIDPLSGASLDRLLALLWRPGVTKVFHAASQDFEVLYRLRGPMPGPFFDTQIAAALLGDDEQIGYGAAVEAHTGVRLAKAHTRTDWSRRPLREVEL